MLLPIDRAEVYSFSLDAHAELGNPIMIFGKSFFAVVALLALSSQPAPTFSAPAPMLIPEDFEQIVEQAFGDRNNAYSWSSIWWKDKLFIGTRRSTNCVRNATLVRWHPRWTFLYPGPKDLDCTADPADLPVQAEIWRWSPSEGPRNGWARIVQSPQIDVPGQAGKLVASDIGFRTMTTHVEQNGTEALYVGGVSAESYLPGVPPARLLRSIDGETFAPVPQDPNTFLGDLRLIDDLPFNGFRSLQSFGGRLFGVASYGLLGQGALIVSETPQDGNDSFDFATAGGADEAFYQLASYNGALYAGTADENGFRVVKSGAAGAPPYDFSEVIPSGGYLKRGASKAVVSLFEFEGRLYVGTDRPAEIYRINPDDTWDLVAGEPRRTPEGMLYPLSGLGAGFDNKNNFHIWRMQDAWGTLYTSTFDQTTKQYASWGRESLAPVAGFDLYGTRDGYYYTLVTRSGLIDEYDDGLRQFAFSPEHGLVAASSNATFGTNVWRAEEPDPDRLPAPERLEAVVSEDSSVLLSWEPVVDAVAYHVFRSDLDADDREFRQVASVGADDTFYRDGVFNPPPETVSHYYVLAEVAPGSRSGPSNTARAPSLADKPTFSALDEDLNAWQAPQRLLWILPVAKVAYRGGAYEWSLTLLERLRSAIEQDPSALTPAWRADDALVRIERLARQVKLVGLGLLSR